MLVSNLLLNSKISALNIESFNTESLEIVSLTGRTGIESVFIKAESIIKLSFTSCAFTQA
jgi:hypothetical protein